MTIKMRRPGAEARALGDVELEDLFNGSLMAHGQTAYEPIAPIIESPSTFITERNRIVYGAIEHLAAEGEFGLSTVANRLYETGELERVGGFGTLNDLPALGADLVPFARTLAEKARRRRALALAEKISRTIEVGDSPSADDIDELRQVTSPTITGKLTIDGLPAVGAVESPVRWIIPDVLPEAALIALTGNSGSGKSTLATAWVRDAIEAGARV